MGNMRWDGRNPTVHISKLPGFPAYVLGTAATYGRNETENRNLPPGSPYHDSPQTGKVLQNILRVPNLRGGTL